VLLDTYSAERQAKARELINFDRDMARLFSAKPRNAEEAAQFQSYFKQHGRYTAGVETRYDPSLITCDDRHQSLARGLVVGKRFHSAPVIRLSDAKPMQLGHAFKADGRWRLLAFAAAGDTGAQDGAIAELCRQLTEGPEALLPRYTPDGADPDSVIDLRAVFQTGHRQMRLENLPAALLPAKGRYGLVDYEKVYSATGAAGSDIYDMRGIDRTRGALVVLRPDQHVAQVLPLSGVQELGAFLAGFMLPR